MELLNIIGKKLKNKKLSEKEYTFVIENYTKNIISEEQMADFIRAIYFYKMRKEEIYFLSKAMVNSGETVNFPDDIKPVFDKHSTGGVGDKLTLILLPLLSSFNVKIAKMSGKSLGHTGGTIDKLNSFENIKLEYNTSEVISHLKKNNVIIMSQSENIAPADKKIYNLRNIIGCVDNLALITSSIISKKVATGSDIIFLDIKVGSGALFSTYQKAKKAAKIMKYVAKRFDKKIIIFITNMSQPLGFSIGNKLEVNEAKDYLNGKKISDIDEITIKSCNLILKRYFNNKKNYSLLIKEKIESKEALNEFKNIIENQNGKFDFDINTAEFEIKSPREGYIYNIDAKDIGMILKDKIRREKNSYDIGIKLNYKVGDYVEKDDKLCTFYCSNITKEEEKDIISSFLIKKRKTKKLKNIFKIIS